MNLSVVYFRVIYARDSEYRVVMAIIFSKFQLPIIVAAEISKRLILRLYDELCGCSSIEVKLKTCRFMINYSFQNLRRFRSELML